MKQMFKTCENAYKVFYHIFLEFENLTKSYLKVYVWRKTIALEIHQQNLVQGKVGLSVANMQCVNSRKC